MKWLAILAALTTPAHAGMFTDNPDQRGEFVIGETCGMCHDAVSGSPKDKDIYRLLSESALFHDTPIDDVFLGYNTHPPTPSTPLPGTLWLLAVPLVWLGRRAMR